MINTINVIIKLIQPKEDNSNFRWVKVHWVTNFNKPNSLSLDSNAMKVNWGWENTMANSLEGPNLMKEWGDIHTLRDHLRPIFC